MGPKFTYHALKTPQGNHDTFIVGPMYILPKRNTGHNPYLYVCHHAQMHWLGSEKTPFPFQSQYIQGYTNFFSSVNPKINNMFWQLAIPLRLIHLWKVTRDYPVCMCQLEVFLLQSLRVCLHLLHHCNHGFLFSHPFWCISTTLLSSGALTVQGFQSPPSLTSN